MKKLVKSYTFEVEVEPDENRCWHAYCPALEKYGAATWGNTKEEALTHIQAVVQMVVSELAEEGTALPDVAKEAVEVLTVSVTVAQAR